MNEIYIQFNYCCFNENVSTKKPSLRDHVITVENHGP